MLLSIIISFSFSTLGYAIIQLPELMLSSFNMLKKFLLRKDTLESNQIDTISLKCSDCNATSAFMTLSRANERYVDLQLVKFMANMERQIDQKINRAQQEILDLVCKRFDET